MNVTYISGWIKNGQESSTRCRQTI